MTLITLMGILVEALGVWRIRILRRGRRCRSEIRSKRVQSWKEQQKRLNGMQGRQIELQCDDCDVSEVSLQATVTPAPPGALPASSNLLCPAVIRRLGRIIIPNPLRIICAKINCCYTRRTNGQLRTSKRYDVIAACLHASRAWLGYLLMLAVMTYAVEFLLSAVFGMVLGRYYFMHMGGGGDEMNGADSFRGGLGGGCEDQEGGGMMLNDGMWGGDDPCCGIEENEDDFHDTYDVVRTSSTEICEPLLSSSLEHNNCRVTRRSVCGQQTEMIA
jgi:hypothetical protein